jgi:DsbC/DsbD-like thiol-disulfide interchange protein
VGLPLLLGDARADIGANYSVRLLAGGRDGEAWNGGVEVRLEPGWKTYWRMPGDAGIPPEFDWAGSQNVMAVEIFWPAPARYKDASGETVGYLDRVIFPLRIVPTEPASPVVLKLSMFFAVCKDICIPATAKAETAFGAASPNPGIDAAIQQFMARVPGKASKPFERATIEVLGEKPVLVLRLTGGGMPEDADVFVEGGGSAYFRAPQAGARPNEVRLTIDGLKETAKLRGKTLKLTLVTPEQGVEQDIAVE